MKNFLTAITLMLGLLFPVLLKAQDHVSQDSTYTTLCEVFSRGKKVEFFFGSDVNFLKEKDSWLSDELGHPLVFKTGLDAVNYLLKRGWKFEQMSVDPVINSLGSENSCFVWILSKEVRNEEDILKGIHTSQFAK